MITLPSRLRSSYRTAPSESVTFTAWSPGAPCLRMRITAGTVAATPPQLPRGSGTVLRKKPDSDSSTVRSVGGNGTIFFAFMATHDPEPALLVTQRSS